MVDSPRKYYSARSGKPSIGPQVAHWRLQNLFLLYRDKDYFKEKSGATTGNTPDTLQRESIVRLGFSAFPFKEWGAANITIDHVLDVVEFLYDSVSRPGPMVDMVTETGWNYQDHESYDSSLGREEFRADANHLLRELGDGFELGIDGEVRSLGDEGLRQILTAEIVPFNEHNVDEKVAQAIQRWRKRHSTLDDKKEAIRLLADVFEWLKKTQNLAMLLTAKTHLHCSI